MWRISSPAEYSLCSENSTDWPWWGLLCNPVRTPSMTLRARTCSGPSRASRAGSRVISARSRARLFQELRDHLPRVHAFGLGVEVGDHPVAQHRLRQRAHVGHVGGG